LGLVCLLQGEFWERAVSLKLIRQLDEVIRNPVGEGSHADMCLTAILKQNAELGRNVNNTQLGSISAICMIDEDNLESIR
jgi:hypothetical protein